MAKMRKPQMVGDEEICHFCHAQLVAKMTNYNGNYEDYLQWQLDGKSHLTTDGCKGQTQETTTAPKPGETPKVSDYVPSALSTDEKIELLTKKIASIEEMTTAIFLWVVDQKLPKEKKDGFS